MAKSVYTISREGKSQNNKMRSRAALRNRMSDMTARKTHIRITTGKEQYMNGKRIVTAIVIESGSSCSPVIFCNPIYQLRKAIPDGMEPLGG